MSEHTEQDHAHAAQCAEQEMTLKPASPSARSGAVAVLVVTGQDHVQDHQVDEAHIATSREDLRRSIRSEGADAELTPASDEDLAAIEEAENDITAGRTYSEDEIRAEFGVPRSTPHGPLRKEPKRKRP